jgi:hypothetical protein
MISMDDDKQVFDYSSGGNTMRKSNFGLLAVFVLTSFRMFGDCGQQQLSCSSSPLGMVVY